MNMKSILIERYLQTGELKYFRILVVFCLCLSLSPISYAQNSILSLGMWNLSALSGEIKVGGLYGFGRTNSYGIDNTEKTSNYYGGLLIKSSSYIWNPNFLIVDIDGGYSPESRQDVYLVFQNHNDIINMRKLHLGATFFPKKPVTLSTYLNYNDLYDIRENLTDIKTNSRNYGGTFGYSNKFLPLSLAYSKTDWDTRELGTDRQFSYVQENAEGRISRSFGVSDKNDLIYTHNDYTRREYDIVAPIRNITDNIALLNSYFFDSAKKTHFNSNILGTNQVGSDSFKQFRATENFYTQLPHSTTFSTTYGYSYVERSIESLGLHNLSAILGNQLYQSLHTDIIYEYNNAQDSYHEINNKIGIGFMYTKKIPTEGLLTIGYNYSRMHEKRTSKDELLNIFNEEYILSDSRRTLLKRPYVDSSSVIVKDANGAPYQNNLDYTLSSDGNYLEIQRVPGGQIPDNGHVFVFYRATQPGKYSYDANLNFFSINLTLFKKLFSVYFRSNRTDYANVTAADFLLLDYLTENIYGTRLEYKFLSGGVEYDDYQSQYVPYKMTRYYLTLTGNYQQRLLFSVNGNWRDYKIPGEDTDRVYKDVSAMVAYSINTKTKLDFNTSYQSQHGRLINLDLVTARARLSTYYRGLTLSAGIDYYDRIYLDNQKVSYLGGNLQIVKNFKY